MPSPICASVPWRPKYLIARRFERRGIVGGGDVRLRLAKKVFRIRRSRQNKPRHRRRGQREDGAVIPLWDRRSGVLSGRPLCLALQGVHRLGDDALENGILR